MLEINHTSSLILNFLTFLISLAFSLSNLNPLSMYLGIESLGVLLKASRNASFKGVSYLDGVYSIL